MQPHQTQPSPHPARPSHLNLATALFPTLSKPKKKKSARRVGRLTNTQSLCLVTPVYSPGHPGCKGDVLPHLGMWIREGSAACTGRELLYLPGELLSTSGIRYGKCLLIRAPFLQSCLHLLGDSSDSSDTRELLSLWNVERQQGKTLAWPQDHRGPKQSQTLCQDSEEQLG